MIILEILVGLFAFLVLVGAFIIIWFMLLLKKTGYLELFLAKEIEKELNDTNGKENG